MAEVRASDHVRLERASAADLIGALHEARERTLEIVADLDAEQLMGPRSAIVNPLRWETGHVGWFHEHWVLRHFCRRQPLLSQGDELYNSAEVAHDTRWDIALPSWQDTLAYVQRIFVDVVDEFEHGRLDDGREVNGYDGAYFLELGLLHECMHAEAFTYTRQTLGYAAPPLSTASTLPGSRAWPIPPSLTLPRKGGGDQLFHPPPRRGRDGVGVTVTPTSMRTDPLGDAQVPGGSMLLGSTPNEPFLFDNEQWGHPVEVAPFAIARAAVTNAEFLAFVEEGGYRRRELWSEAGWQWRATAGAEHPVYWQRHADGVWLRRNFAEWVPLEGDLPVLHVGWYEADAYCRWAGRRLPTEAEWEMAASAEPTPDGRSLTGRKRRYPWGDEPPTPERANLDWRAEGCVSAAALPASDSAFGCRQMIGNVWEWTSTDFGPFPGFSPGPYKEYSAPWFGDHKVLRGGCWVTRSRLIRNNYRNFYKPDRRDVWAGFRTCAL